MAACSARVPPPPEPPSAVRRGDQAFRYRDYDGAIKAYRSYSDLVMRDEYTRA